MKLRHIIITLCLLLVATQASARIGIIVNNDLYPFVQDSVDQFVFELEARGENVWLNTTSFDATSSITTLRAVLGLYYAFAGLEGVIFIGDLPIAEYEIQNDFGKYGYRNFPIDLYFMDLDGTWSDNALDGDWGGNATTGIFDEHSDGSGDREAEIWVSRITASAVPGLGSEADVVNAYFTRLKTWMDGDDTIDHELLIFGNDSEWPSTEAWGGATLLDFLPAETETYFRSDADDTDVNWMAALRDGKKYALITEHSGPTSHGMLGGFTNTEYLNMPITGTASNTRFYNLFACSISRYTVPDFLGGLYAWGHNGLISLGSTKTGAMLGFNTYNTQLGAGETFGESFKYWFNDYVLSGPVNAGKISWHYGMTLSGAGTLTLNYQYDICFSGLPNPALSLEDTEVYSIGSKTFTRFKLNVSNAGAFPDAMFAAAPHLPPCGLNTNSSRTWVRIYDNNDNYLYGFCALGSSASLNDIWFSIEVGKTIPDSAYIVLWDRECGTQYVSNTIAIAQNMPIPPYKSTYSSSSTSRGFYFTAPKDFIITGLKVPDELGTGRQNVAVIKFDAGVTPPVYPATTNSFDLLYRRNGVSSSNYIEVYIPVSAGDVIGILGAAGDAAMLRTSYGNGNFASSIGGSAVTLRRLGMQYNMVTNSPRNVWTTNADLGRVDLKYVSDPPMR